MITKAILAEKILRKLNGGDFNLSSSKIKKNDVYLEMEAAYGYVVQMYINQSGEEILGEFITTYPQVLISQDVLRKRLFSFLPAQLVSLTGGKGLRQISGTLDEFEVFVLMNAGDEGLYYGLEAGSLGGKYGYWLEGNKIYYKNIDDRWIGKSVMVKMVSSIYSLGEDDYIPIPAGAEAIFEDETVKRLMPQKQIPNSSKQNNEDLS